MQVKVKEYDSPEDQAAARKMFDSLCDARAISEDACVERLLDMLTAALPPNDDPAYLAMIDQLRTPKGKRALIAYLKSRDLTGFDPNGPTPKGFYDAVRPKTERIR